MKRKLPVIVLLCLVLIATPVASMEETSAPEETHEVSAERPQSPEAPEAPVEEFITDIGSFAGEASTQDLSPRAAASKTDAAQAVEEAADESCAEEASAVIEYIPYPDICSREIRKRLTASKRVYPGTLLWPLKGTEPLKHITSHVGWRNAARIHGNQSGTWPSWLHHGIDVGNVDTSQVVVAAASGLAYAGVKNGCGRYVVIDHGNGWYTEYQHLSSFAGAVYRGCRALPVKAGDAIGYVGNSGGDYPVHFHFEIAWSPNGGGATAKKYFRQTKNRRVYAYSFPQARVIEMHWSKTWEICTAEAQYFVADVADMMTWREGEIPRAFQRQVYH